MKTIIHLLISSLLLTCLQSLRAQCNASNTPTFVPSVSISSLSVNGLCGSALVALNANTMPPGGTINYSITGPGFSGPVGSTVVTIPGTYTLTITDINTNCSASATVYANVYAAPQLTLAASSTTICRSDLVTCTVSGASNYLWSNGPTTATFSNRPSSSITYSVIGTSSLGCAATGSITITVKPLPPLLYSVTNDPVCEQGTLSFTATGAATYTWNSAANGSVFTTPAFITLGSYPYYYTVAGTGTNGCVSTYSSAITITVTSCSGLIEQPSVPFLSIYPNPVNGVLEIESQSKSAITAISIHSNTGQLLYCSVEQVGLNHVRINTEALSKGYYFICIHSESGTAYRTFVK